MQILCRILHILQVICRFISKIYILRYIVVYLTTFLKVDITKIACYTIGHTDKA